jgi:predicted nucleic acid-binding protein
MTRPPARFAEPRITEADHGHAHNALLAAGRRTLSLVDCGSFHVMSSRAVRSAFTFDPHFVEQGFEVLPSGNGPDRGPANPGL